MGASRELRGGFEMDGWSLRAGTSRAGWLGRSLPSKAGRAGVSHGVCEASVGSGRANCAEEDRAWSSLSSSAVVEDGFVFHRSQMRNATATRSAGRRPQHEHRPRLVPLHSPDQTPQKGDERGEKARATWQNSLFKAAQLFPTKPFPLLFNAPFLDSAGHCAQQVLGFLPSTARVPSM